MSRARCRCEPHSSPELRRCRLASKPVIGCSVGYHDFGDYQGVGFQRPILMAGGIPLILSRVEGTIDDHARRGRRASSSAAAGTSSRTATARSPTSSSVMPDPRRDEFELELVERSLDRGLPLLGMCRGIQVINVGLGGTLVQDVSLRPEWEEHPTDRGWHRWKEVERASLERRAGRARASAARDGVEPGSRLHEALGVDEIEVNSFHHQAIDRPRRRPASDRRRARRRHRGDRAGDDDGYVLAAQFELQEEWRVDRAVPGYLPPVRGGRSRQALDWASRSGSRRPSCWGLADFNAAVASRMTGAFRVVLGFHVVATSILAASSSRRPASSPTSTRPISGSSPGSARSATLVLPDVLQGARDRPHLDPLADRLGLRAPSRLILAVLVLDEVLTTGQLIAALVIIGGVLLASADLRAVHTIERRQATRPRPRVRHGRRDRQPSSSATPTTRSSTAGSFRSS